MRYCNLFSSIQGEGLFAGIPTTFLRLSGCNLRCSYCDAPEGFDQEKMHDEKVSILAEKIRNSAPLHLTITGGEPLCQESDLHELLHLIHRDKIISIETNGTFSLKKLSSDFPQLFFSIDWKTPSSGSTDFNRENLLLDPSHTWIKCVAGDQEDLDFIAEIEPLIPHAVPLLISPVFEKGETWFKLVSSYIMTHFPSGRCRMQLQLHKIIGVE